MWPPHSFRTGTIFTLECLLYNLFHAFFTSLLHLIVNLRRGTRTQPCSKIAPSKMFDCVLNVPVLCACNYLSVNFPTQLFLQLSRLLGFKAFSFSTFPIFYETHTPALHWQQIVLQRLVTSSSLFLNNWGTEIIGIRP